MSAGWRIAGWSDVISPCWAGLHLLFDEPEGHGVVMPVDIDVVVERDAPNAPLGVDEGLGRQRLEGWAVELGEHLGTADAEALHRPGIQVYDELRDGGIEFGERE